VLYEILSVSRSNTVQRAAGTLTSLYGNRQLIGTNISRTEPKIKKFYLIFSSYFDEFYRNPSSDLSAPRFVESPIMNSYYMYIYQFVTIQIIFYFKNLETNAIVYMQH